ncbi:hypothetical protein ANO11243_048740 [Dothideomycetidae sp. 11243]|nr:hypothetical protein ANO11243_048740 [fungal sp. No.11243]
MAAQQENISDALIWQITRKSNAFLVKRTQAGGVQFSRDPHNLLNKHTSKYSGYANSRAIGVSKGENNKITVSTKTHGKAHQPARAHHAQTYGAGKSARNVSRSAVGGTAKKGYRSDLRRETVARVSALKKAQRPVRERPTKTRTGKKAKVAETEA